MGTVQLSRNFFILTVQWNLPLKKAKTFFPIVPFSSSKDYRCFYIFIFMHPPFRLTGYIVFDVSLSQWDVDQCADGLKVDLKKKENVEDDEVVLERQKVVPIFQGTHQCDKTSTLVRWENEVYYCWGRISKLVAVPLWSRSWLCAGLLYLWMRRWIFQTCCIGQSE